MTRLIEVDRFVEHDSVSKPWPSYNDAFAFLGRLRNGSPTIWLA
jgi:hypothetical protein